MMNPTRTSELAAAINQRHAEAAARILAPLRDAIGRIETEVAAAPLVAESDLETLLPPAAPAPTGPGIGVLKQWVARIDEDHNQVSILKSLLDASHQFAARVCLFLIRGDAASTWAAAGFTGCGNTTDERVKSVSLSLHQDTVLKHVAEAGQAFVGHAAAHGQNRLLLDALGQVDPVEIGGFPFINKGRVAAVLYVDSGNATDGIAAADAIDVLCRVASMSVELIAVRPKAQQPAAAPHPAAAARPATPAAAPAAARPAPAPTHPAPTHPAPTHPAPTHPAPTHPTPAPAAPARPAAADLSQLPVEEQKLHEAAKRFARLLVSEIRLYNEAKVQEGKQHRDLYNRLKDDIERSRHMYNQRVNPKIAQTTNYFWDELVRSLAEGDASLLAGFQA